jgi:hypothetical protein
VPFLLTFVARVAGFALFSISRQRAIRTITG